MEQRSKRVEQGEKTRQDLLTAARQLFGTVGYGETSLDAIVRRAGVTKGAFYHHFTGKAQIFQRVFEDLKRDLSRAAFVTHREVQLDVPTGQRSERPVAELTASQSEERIWRDLVARCRRFIELHTDPAVHRIVLIDARSVLDWSEWHRIENEYGVVLIRADLRRLMNRGVLSQLPLNTLSRMLAGALNEACLLVADAEDRGASLEEAVQIVEQMLEGLRIRATESA